MKKRTRNMLWAGGAAAGLAACGIITEIAGPKDSTNPEGAAPTGTSQAGGEVPVVASSAAGLACKEVIGLAQPNQEGGDDMPVKFTPVLTPKQPADAANVKAVFTMTDPEGGPVGDSETYEGKGSAVVFMMSQTGRLALTGDVAGEAFDCGMVTVQVSADKSHPSGTGFNVAIQPLGSNFDGGQVTPSPSQS
jgi:hypothetical protein